MLYRFPKQNNPHWPLPPDYPTLSERGKKLARLNAVRLQKTPEDFVAAWSFFREHYLFPTPKGQFYEHGVVASPLFHYQLVRDLATYPMNAWSAPRSAAKSTVLAMEVPLLLSLTRNHFSTSLLFSTNRLVVQRFDRFMAMIQDNELIINDFGRMKPPRGSGLWNHSAIKLMNGSAIYGAPIEGQLLGGRCPLILIDDVEYDPALIHQPTSKSEKFQYMMSVVILPMREAGTCIGIIGTTHRRDFYLHHVMTSDDPAYSGWNRRAVTVFNNDGSLMWGEKLSQEFLDQQRLLIGSDAAFAASYLGQPGTDDDRILKIHPELNQYSVEDKTGNYLSNPLVSDASLISHRKIGLDEKTGQPTTVEESRVYGDTVSRMFRVICMDYAYTRHARSDYSCIAVMGFESNEQYRDVMWVLDLWLGKVPDDMLINTLWSMSKKWMPHVVGIEAVGVQQQIHERIQSDFGERAAGGWSLRVVPVKYPAKMEKSHRIAGLEWRFNQGRIKLPLHLRRTWPFRELYYQFENFTLDLALLKHDDAADGVAMSQFVVRPRNQSYESDVLDPPTDPVELLRQGETLYESGIPIISSFGVQDLTPEVVGILRERYLDDMGIPRAEED